MNKHVAAVRSAQWRKIVHECINREPKVSKRRWCDENGVNFRSLMYWQRKLQLEAIDLMSKSKSSLPAQAAPADVPAFVDVTAQLETVQTEEPSVPREPECFTLAPELMIQAGAYRIYVNSSIHEDTLEKVLRVIRHA